MADEDRRGGRPRRNRLTAARRSLFLEVLADTSNVEQAALAAMAVKSSFYRLRDRNAEFAAAWETALARGYETIEGQLLAAAHGAGSVGGADPQLGLAMLKRRDGMVAGHAGYGRKTCVVHVSIGDVEKAVVTRLEAIARRWSRA